MEQSKVFSILRETGLPVTYAEFPPGQAQPLPYIIFYQMDVLTFNADNRVYRFNRQYMIELCNNKRDSTLEGKVFEILDKHDIVWSYSGETRTDEGIYISYVEI